MIFLIVAIVLVLIAGFVLYYSLFVYEPSSSDVFDRADTLQKRYDPNMTNASARRQVQKSQARTEAASQLQNEIAEVVTLEAQKANVLAAEFLIAQTPARLNRQELLDITQNQLEVDDITLQRNLITFAQQNGMDVATYLEVLKTRSLNELEMEKIETQAHAELKAGFIFQLQAYQRLAMLRDNLDTLYERAHQIETGNEPSPVKLRKLAQVEEDIKLHEEDIRARRKRLVSATDREEEAGDTEESDTSGNP